MPRRKSVAAKEDVPMWFMTYSDVITLMMTFFILLLTFATSEPERFEKMKITLFGQSSASGLAGSRPDGIEKDSWVVRVRPRSSRMVDRGTEIPIDDDQPEKSMNAGLSGLEEDESRQIVDVIQVNVPANHFGSPDGELFEYGKKNMHMLADLMRRRAYEVTLQVSDSSQLPRAIACLQHLYHQEQIDADRLGVQHDAKADVPPTHMRMILRAISRKTKDVQETTQTPVEAQ